MASVIEMPEQAAGRAREEDRDIEAHLRTLLAVTYHFPPSAASGTHRLLGFARNLPAAGWKMSVVAPPSLPWEPIDDALVAQVPESSSVFPADYPQGFLTWPLRRACGLASWLPFAHRAMRRAVRASQPSAVLTSGPPHCVHMAGLYLKRRYGLPWIADFRDPWVTGQFLKGPWTQTRLLDRLGESWVFRWADAIIVNAPNALTDTVQECPQLAGKIHCVTNGFDPANFAGISKTRRQRFVIAHIGELYAGRDPRPLLDAVRLLIERNTRLTQSVLVEFIGTASLGCVQLEHEIRSRGLTEHVSVVGQVPYRESLQRMVDANVLLLIDSPNRRIGVPAKLYEYFGAQRPILAMAADGSDVDWALRASGLPHRLTPLDDVDRIVNALEGVLQAGVGDVRAPATSQFSRSVIAARLAAILDHTSHRAAPQ